ncbi:MAG: aminopeptidase [Rhodobacteraceae bacterium]|nr:aminopeptidase [Paracoccaceae bacterium]
MVTNNWDESTELDKLAELSIKTGVALQQGQDLLITAPLEAAPLVRRLTFHAYKQGCGIVTPLYTDPEVTLLRYKNAQKDSFDKATDWLFEAMGAAFDKNTARLAVVGEDPMLLSEQNADDIGRANQAVSKASSPVRERITRFNVNWNIIAWPGTQWAKRVFPNLEEAEAQEQLARAIFQASRLDGADPIENWNIHNKNLRTKTDWLNAKNFASLHFYGDGTDLKVGLAEGHEWMGGASKARNGVICNPNIPSEEVFTTPHALKVDGYVKSTKPLSHQGTLIENISVVFQNGRITEAKASKGQEVFLKLIDTDDGARRLGEVALVPHSSPISQSNLLFYNTLFDENAACHIALGQCYSKCFKDGDTLSKDEVIKNGGNSSMIHVDWMIGSDTINIDGLDQDGGITPVFRAGEWAL